MAGPLVNVVLVPITVGLLGGASCRPRTKPADALHCLYNLACINAGLLFFNMLPIYPLDGGQTLQAVLWFVLGRAWSLLVVSMIGLVVGATGWFFASGRVNGGWHSSQCSLPVTVWLVSVRAGHGSHDGFASAHAIRLSRVRHVAACGRILGLRPLPHPLRHVRTYGPLSWLRRRIT